MIDTLRNIFSKFPKVFWVAQTFEMMERGAYYSMMPIIVIHAIYNVGLNPYIGGMIAAFMYPFQYGLPIFTGALAEKVGYRRQIIFAFSFLTMAYILLFMAFDTLTMILAVMAVGVGIGSYKPLISATVAKCTISQDRNLAYSIYYWIVNLAAFIFPLFFVIAELTGYLPESAYYYVFLIGGIIVSINLLTAIFIFEEVPRSGQVKTVADAVKNIKIAFQDKKFVVMVVLIGGFWALYSTMLFAIQIIGYGYRWFPAFLTAMALGIPNPMTIILLGPIISKYIKKVESMRVVLGGLIVYLIGLIILGFSLRQWELIILGIIIASVGEFMVAPGYLAFISKLAPKENISAYIGCNFISYMIGLLGGTIVFSYIVNYVGVDLRMPYLFYGILISFGLFLIFAFTIYYRTWGQDIIERANKIKELEEGIGEKSDIISDYKEPFIFRLFDNNFTPIISLILIPIILFASFSMGTFNYIGPPPKDGEVPPPKYHEVVVIGTETGYSQENGFSDVTFNIPEDQFRLLWVNCTLFWIDEISQYFQGTNEPDEFRVSIITPNEETVAESTFSTAQPVSASVSLNYTDENFKDNYLGDWTIRVEAGTCGDDSAFIPILGLRVTEDPGNDWSLDYEYVYKENVKES